MDDLVYICLIVGSFAVLVALLSSGQTRDRPFPAPIQLT